METTLLATSHDLQEWKAGTKSCQMQQCKYTFGISGPIPMTDPTCASPYSTLTKRTMKIVLTLVWPGSHCRVLIHALLGCRNMFYTHQSDRVFSAFGNQNPQTAALILKDRACLQKGRSQDAGWFLRAPVTKMPSFSAWIFSPGEFEDYVHLTTIFQ